MRADARAVSPAAGQVMQPLPVGEDSPAQHRGCRPLPGSLAAMNDEPMFRRACAVQVSLVRKPREVVAGNAANDCRERTTGFTVRRSSYGGILVV